MADEFTREERAALAPYFTNLDGPVFALVNLPEVVKGALFARYSRSPKSLRRLFLDEFRTAGSSAADAARGVAWPVGDAGTKRAEQLYERVFVEYGDDSVAQLGGVHLACEGASNILTKVLEWGRLMAYLEQSTRYIPYDDRPGGRYRYHVPAELDDALRQRYVAALDGAFDSYREWLPRMRAFYETKYPRDPAESDTVYRMTIRAKALDTLRGMLPAATISHVGIYGTGQAYEQLLLRMRAHPLAEVRAYAELMLAELRRVIPAFLKRVDLPERGGASSRYLAATRAATQEVAARLLDPAAPEPREEADWTRVLGESAELHDAIVAAGLPEVASYAVAMAYRVRFYMEMNAREAMHVIELRTTPQGHPAYRRICQAMHRLIAERAGHRAIAAAMTFADHSAVELERLEAERAAARRRAGA